MTAGSVATRLALPASLSSKLEVIFKTQPLGHEQLLRVRRLGEAHEPIDHDSDGVAFAYLYFGANYAKTYLAAAGLRKHAHALRILDLGAGSGASICGLMTRIREKGMTVDELRIVERSERQLGLFEAAAKPWLKETFPGLKLTMIEDDAVARLAMDASRWDVITSSYLFCELSGDQQEKLTLLLAQRSRNTQCIVIDSIGRGTVTLDPRNRSWIPLLTAPFEIDLPFLRSVRFDQCPRYAVEDAATTSVAPKDLSESLRPLQ